MKSVLKVKSKNTQVTQEKVEPKYVEDKATEQYLDYINESGNVMRHNGDKYVNTGINLKGPRGAVGPRGLPGKDGITPHIGENGNWYIGEQDTGSKAELNTDEYVTKEELEDVIGNAPEALDTLKELADSLGNDANFAIHVNNSINELKENLIFTETTDPADGHDYVEIGGIKWATMNVGAESETDYGLYFAWGDTQGYTASQVGRGEGQKYFGWADYKYGNGTSSPRATNMTKYNSTDGKTVLEASDDAAVANWGGSWRMPTTAEFQALGAAVNAVWTTDYNGSGVNGILCTDKTDSSKTLFFPAAGYCYKGSVKDVGSYGNYWPSSLYTSGKENAYGLTFGSSKANWKSSRNRYYGCTVRGVLDNIIETEPITTTYTANRVVIPIDPSKNAAVNEGVINIHTAVPYITDTENYLVVKESENLHSGTVIIEANLSGKGLCCPANIIYEQNKYYIYPSLPLDNIKDNLKNLILYCY